MPNYDYKCLECQYEFEVFQKMTDSALTECPACKGSVKRLIGAGLGPIFKGSGFYQTDYKNSKPASTSTSDTASAATGKLK
ncbi:MAG: zinc ribbon domain-containing protein [Bacteroidetes bacterium]|nr:zinc ribbon domain-containing protein [Bacteroidota bacterium]